MNKKLQVTPYKINVGFSFSPKVSVSLLGHLYSNKYKLSARLIILRLSTPTLTLYKTDGPINVELEYFEKENHRSVPLIALYKGLKYINQEN